MAPRSLVGRAADKLTGYEELTIRRYKRSRKRRWSVPQLRL